MRVETEVALECFLWGLDVLSRRDCGLILAGAYGCKGDRQLDRLIERLRRQKLLEQTGHGSAAKFAITDIGRKRLRVETPTEHWNHPWDGQWRAFLFDFPSTRTKERQMLWRALRSAKMGLLQRSVWIWPHEVEPYLRAVIQGHGIPECFCGFRASSLFLCDNVEVVRTGWNFERIRHAHDIYLQHLVGNVHSVNRARDLQVLARVGRIERDAYRDAFWFDPLLPRELWPKAYQGPLVEERHQKFLACLRSRAKALATA
jgi:DNA-binding transcriptional regulator PaaX